MKDTLPKQLLYVVGRFPTKAAVEHKVQGTYRPITYRDLWISIRRFSRGLWAQGIRAGDRVAIVGKNSPDWAVADWAVICLGAVSVPLFPTLTAEQIGYILKNADVKLVIAGDKHLGEKVLEAMRDLPGPLPIVLLEGSVEGSIPRQVVMDTGDGAAITDNQWLDRINSTRASETVTFIYTSGTTGQPKGVVLNHVNFMREVEELSAYLPISQSDKFFSFLPLNHVTGRVADHFLPFSLGATVAYADTLLTMAADIQATRPTILVGVPRLFERMQETIIGQGAKLTGIRRRVFDLAVKVARNRGRAMGRRENPGMLNHILHKVTDRRVGGAVREKLGGKLRFCAAGGAALRPETAEFFAGFGILILEGYGLSETTAVAAINHPDDFRFGTVGHPLPGAEIKIAPDGEILCRGPIVMRGYHDLPNDTKEALDDQGFFRTGDIGSFDSGYLRITDRKKELIVLSNGKNVAPQAVENLLKSETYIEDAIVFGDGQPTVSALIVPNVERIMKWAADSGRNLDEAELRTNATVRKLIKADVDQANTRLAEFEQVKRFELLASGFSIEGGELTPTLKLKRRAIYIKYADTMREMLGDD